MDTEDALVGIKSELDTIRLFWARVLGLVHAFTQQSSVDGATKIVKMARGATASWRASRDDLKVAIRSVAASRVRISVQATASPPFRRRTQYRLRYNRLYVFGLWMCLVTGIGLYVVFILRRPPRPKLPITPSPDISKTLLDVSD
jgi:hypothetical protein